MSLNAGDLLQGRYRIAGPLGFGGMGSVFLAHEEPFARPRVVKQLRLDTPELLPAFRDEFALLSRLSHPHLVEVLDFASERIRGQLVHYYVAELVAGVTLSQHAERAATRAELLRPWLDALEGLAALHDAGIRHGDFTPANVMVGEDGRGVLIDLGCARPFGASSTLSGTPGFLAPELLAGDQGDARSDLFAVGQTLSRVLGIAKHTPSSDERRVIERLTRAEPRARPSDVREILEAFRRKTSSLARAVVPHRLLGRASVLAELESWLASARQRSGPAVCTLLGAPGSGLSRLTQELSARAALEQTVLRARAYEPACVARLLATALGVREPIDSLGGALAAVSVLAERAEPCLLVVEDLERLDADERELLLALGRALPAGSSLALLLTGQARPASLDAHVITCPPLELGAVREWALPFMPERRIPELLRETQGLPGAIEAALREATGELGKGRRGADTSAARQAIRALSTSARAALAELSVLDNGDSEGSPPSELGLTGLVRREGARYRLSAEAAQAIVQGAVSRDELAAAHRRVASAALASEPAATPSTLSRLIAHLVAGGELEQAERLFSGHYAELELAPPGVANKLSSLFRASRDAELVLQGAALSLRAKQPRLAVQHAVRAARCLPALSRRALPIVADGLLRLGKPARAQRLLEQHPDDAACVQRLARVLLARGAYRPAFETAQRALGLASTDALRALAHEVTAVAASYLGELETARVELHAVFTLLGADAAPSELYRIRSHAGLVAFRMGRIDDAVNEYGSALALAETHELDDQLGVALLNLGTAEQQAGLWGSALRRYERGLGFARATNRTDTALTLELNLANLYVEIGELERAEAALERLERQVGAQRLAHLSATLRLIRAEIALWREQHGIAEELLTEAELEATHSGQARELFEVRLRRVELDLQRGDLVAAAQRIAALEAARSDARDLTLQLELCRARLGVARGERSALNRLTALEGSARDDAATVSAALIAGELSQARLRLEPGPEANLQRERARRLWDRVALDLPSALGPAFWRHPRRRALAELSQPTTTIGEGDSSALRRLLALNRRLNSPHSLERVLDYALQAALDLTGAERGFVLLVQAESLVLAASSEHGAAPSQSIARRVIDRQEPLLTTDAQADPRFAAQGSVHALQLKSVLCVPIVAASGTLGAIYVDSRLQARRFGASDRDLLSAFAEQAAIAIANKRLLEEVERQREALEKQTRLLEQAARGHAQELERLRREVLTQQQGLDLRYDYSQIVGRGPAMRRVLERLDRVTDASINVLVLGESGTGKELVARAIHWNGPRRAGPFLGINCAALPESLLESELFGHVRGAFTGADRDKTGLLVAANGGTLFLDEVGELPLATQVKLLRVLQEREVRPVGSAASVPLDIRVVAATHRDLPRDAERGTFREDLFYRLAVVTIEVPPLRERLEDLPVLAQRILEGLGRDASQPASELAPDALRKLSAHPFRGNVRELQNVLTRAFVLKSGARIRAQDIDFDAPASGSRQVESRGDFEAQERERILGALRSARWNVSAVSATLGIPRVTLHRKLKKYGLTREATSKRAAAK